MSNRALWITVCAVTALFLMAGIAGARSGMPEAAVAVNDAVSYQGRLTDTAGKLLSGTFKMTFRLYSTPNGGTALWASGDQQVVVADGLFDVTLDVAQSQFRGAPLYLEISVQDEVLSPRQELLPAPYALGLRPGAVVEGEPPSADAAVFGVSMQGFWPTGKAIAGFAPATGSAVHAEALGGPGVFGHSANDYGVWGRSDTSWGGYFSSAEGYGLRVDSDGTDHYDHGAYITANDGYALYAQSANNMAVRGEAGDISGITPPLGAVGVVGLGQSRGMFGGSGNGSGVYGFSQNNYGGWFQSQTYRGVTGRTSRTDNNYGLYTPDNLFAANATLAGAVMQVVQNSGTEPIEAGDVAVFNGIGMLAGTEDQMIVQVAKANQANSQAVAGVVYSGFNINAIEDGPGAPVDAAAQADTTINLPGPVQPGEYLLLVVYGPVQVKNSAATGAVAVGDLLSASGTGGAAASAATAAATGAPAVQPGSVFGKALEASTPGKDRIYAFVTLQ